MNTSTSYRSIQTRLSALFTAVLLSLTLTLSGCGNGLSGEKYVEADGKDGIEFKSGAEAYITMMGHTIEAEYSVDDEKILIKANG